MDGATITRSDRRVLQALIRDLPQQADALVRAAATEMTGDIVLGMGPSPSAPGEFPGVDSGVYRASIGWEMVGLMHAIIYGGTDYGPKLELGTERMAARPHFSPVFEDWRHRKFARLARDLGIFTGRYA